MKKILSIIIILMVVLSGCQNSEKPNTNSENNQQISQGTDQTKKQENDTTSEKKQPELPGALLVMVDNYYKARPQSGLDKADWVYEMMAEGGITRYCALFYTKRADEIGPIRSARYYFVHLAKGYDMPLAHAGGSTYALSLIQELKIKDLDEIYNAGSYFWRDKTRKMPHNLYSSTDLLLKGVEAKKFSMVKLPESHGTEWKSDLQTERFTIVYGTGKDNYEVNWVFNGKQYERKINGKPHIMRDGTPIKADNILVISARTKNVVKDGIVLSEIDLIDSGKAKFFINGSLIEGRWEKKSSAAPMKFYTSNGQELLLKTGITWVQVIPDMSSLKSE